MTYLEFKETVQGYKFFNKKTNQQVYNFELFLMGISAIQCHKRYDVMVRNYRIN